MKITNKKINIFVLRSCRLDLLRVLVACPRVDINTVDKNGLIPLMWCLKYHKVETLKILLESARVDFNVKTGIGKAIEKHAR